MSKRERSVDVLVVGGGIAGLVAAARAQELGRTVLVVDRGAGASLGWSGAVDVADALCDLVPGPDADPLERGGTIEAAVASLCGRWPDHPYARLRANRGDVLHDALTFFVRRAAALDLAFRPDGKNHVVATSLGLLKRTAAVPRAQLLDLADAGDDAIVGVVESKDVGGFDAAVFSSTLAWACGLGGHPRAAVPLVVDRVLDGDVLPDVLAAAAVFTRPAVRAAFARRIVAAIEGAPRRPTHLLMPSLLGVGGVSSLQSVIGMPVAELPSFIPSVAGRMLQASLAEGLEVVSGSVQGLEWRERLIASARVTTSDDEMVVTPQRVVLAAGRFVGGGIVRDLEAREPVAGLEVQVDRRPLADIFVGDLTDRHPGGKHAVFRAGVFVDDTCAPVDLQGTRAHANLWCAGSLVAGYDPTQDGSAAGVAVLTGFVAGTEAARAEGGLP